MVDRLLDGLFEFAPDAIFVIDGGGRILRVNARVGALFGYVPDELVGQPIERLVPAHLREGHAALRAGYSAHPHVRDGHGLDLRGMRKDARVLIPGRAQVAA